LGTNPKPGGKKKNAITGKKNRGEDYSVPRQKMIKDGRIILACPREKIVWREKASEKKTTKD